MKNHTPLKLAIDTLEEVLQCCAPVLTGLGQGERLHGGVPD